MNIQKYEIYRAIYTACAEQNIDANRFFEKFKEHIPTTEYELKTFLVQLRIAWGVQEMFADSDSNIGNLPSKEWARVFLNVAPPKRHYQEGYPRRVK